MDAELRNLFEKVRKISPAEAFQLVLQADSEEECRFWAFVLYMNMGGLGKED